MPLENLSNELVSTMTNCEKMRELWTEEIRDQVDEAEQLKGNIERVSPVYTGS